MPTAANPDKPSNRQGILAILAVQVAVLLALCGAAIVYINWSSSAAQAEFVNALQQPLSGSGNFPQSSTPTQAKAGVPCTRKG